MERTIETIISSFEERVRNRLPIPPNEWLEASMMLIALLGNESDKLAEIKQEVSKMKASLILEGKSVAAAKIIVEASEDYKNYLKQEAKIEQVMEWVRLSKKMASLKSEEYWNNK